MESVKNILLPIDFFDDARAAINAVLAFLRTTPGHFKLWLLASYQVPASSADAVVPAHDEWRRQADSRLQELVASVTAEPIALSTLVRLGAPVNVLTRTAQDPQFHAVIVGRTQLAKADPTVQLANLLKELHCPLMVLP